MGSGSWGKSMWRRCQITFEESYVLAILICSCRISPSRKIVVLLYREKTIWNFENPFPPHHFSPASDKLCMFKLNLPQVSSYEQLPKFRGIGRVLIILCRFGCKSSIEPHTQSRPGGLWPSSTSKVAATVGSGYVDSCVSAK